VFEKPRPQLSTIDLICLLSDADSRIITYRYRGNTTEYRAHRNSVIFIVNSYSLPYVFFHCFRLLNSKSFDVITFPTLSFDGPSQQVIAVPGHTFTFSSVGPAHCSLIQCLKVKEHDESHYSLSSVRLQPTQRIARYCMAVEWQTQEIATIRDSTHKPTVN